MHSVTAATRADAWWLASPIITAVAVADGLSGAGATTRLSRSGPDLFR